jgi:hypothetical protein
MNLAMEGIYAGTLAFAPYLGRPDITATTTPSYADVFARRERQSAASYHEPKTKTVYVEYQNRSGVITYPDSNTEPPWLVPVLRSLLERRGVKPGWDSYDAKPTEAEHAARLLACLFRLMRDDSKPPIMTPLWDGGVQATWHRAGKDLEIAVSADDPPSYYFRDEATGEEEEEQLQPSRFQRVQALIQQF